MCVAMQCNIQAIYFHNIRQHYTLKYTNAKRQSYTFGQLPRQQAAIQPYPYSYYRMQPAGSNVAQHATYSDCDNVETVGRDSFKW